MQDIHFRPIELSDKAWMDPLVFAEGSPSSDFNFGNLFLWDGVYRQEVAQLGDRVAVFHRWASEPFFVFPIGAGDPAPALEALEDFARRNDLPFVLRGVTRAHRDYLERCFPGRYGFTADRALFDYVYSAQALAALTGKKYHGKRNHINNFLATVGDWRFTSLTEALAPDCAKMLETWTEENAQRLSDGIDAEHTAIIRALEFLVPLGLEGGCLFAGDRLVAFTIGEQISGEVFNIHFEKAFTDIQGSYAMINREFVRHLLEAHPGLRYINREDDTGNENLRQAKMSYNPEFLVEKFTARKR